MKRCFVALSLVTVLLSLTGCWTSRWPYGMSLDRHNYLSTPSMPLTIVLRDTVTHDELLRIDVPVRKMLVLDLEHKEDWTPALTNALPAEKVYWQIVNPGEWMPGTLDNEMALPGNEVMIVVEIRDPEASPDTTTPPAYAPTQRAAGTPTYTPSGPAVRTQTPQPRPQPAQPTATQPPVRQAVPAAAPPPQPYPTPPGSRAGHGLGASDARPRPERPQPQPQPESPPQESPPQEQPEAPAETEPEPQPEPESAEPTPPPGSEQEQALPPDQSESQPPPPQQQPPQAEQEDEEESDTYQPEYTPSGDKEPPPADLEEALE